MFPDRASKITGADIADQRLVTLQSTAFFQLSHLCLSASKKNSLRAGSSCYSLAYYTGNNVVIACISTNTVPSYFIKSSVSRVCKYICACSITDCKSLTGYRSQNTSTGLPRNLVFFESECLMRPSNYIKGSRVAQ